MAKQAGIVPFVGTIGGINFYALQQMHFHWERLLLMR